MKYLAEYQLLHKQKLFKGMSILNHVPDIAELVSQHGGHHILDYWCGLGWQYTHERVHRVWDREIPTLYDPAVRDYSIKPIGQFDGVICTDVLEHVPENELDAMLREIAGFAKTWVFLSVCCRPSRFIKFSDGTNVHVTIHPFEWWQAYLKPYFNGKTLVLRETK